MNHIVNIGFEEKAKKLKQIIEKRLEIIFLGMPSNLVYIFQNDCILSGSSISSLYHGEEPKDYDFWCRISSDIKDNKTRLIEDYSNYIQAWSDKYGDDSQPVGDKKLMVTANAITFTNTAQFITLGDYKTCRQSFDFVHCMPYYDWASKKFFISPQQMEAIENKQLITNGDKPLRLVKEYRIEKFKQRGWKVV